MLVMQMPVFTADQLKEVATRIFIAAGSTPHEAATVAELLVKANLAGHDSHGIIRVPQYFSMMRDGRIKAGAEPEVVRDSGCTALVDGHLGFGQIAATKAMEIAIEKARRYGVGAVGAFNCNHVGRLADFAEMALKEQMIGVVLCNGPPIVAPYGGIDRVFNTGPISLAVPCGDEKPFLLDIATSMGAEGKVRLKLSRGKQLPVGWIVDKDGNPSREPKDLYDGGAMLPLGGEVGYKGFGLGMFIDLVGGALTGAGCAVEKGRRGINGVFLMAISIERFTSVEDFRKRADGVVRAIKGSRRALGFHELMIPGEPERKEEGRRLRTGIFVEDATWRNISKIAQELGVSLGEHLAFGDQRA